MEITRDSRSGGAALKPAQPLYGSLGPPGLPPPNGSGCIKSRTWAILYGEKTGSSAPLAAESQEEVHTDDCCQHVLARSVH